MAETTQQAFLDRVRQAMPKKSEPADLPDDLSVARVIKTDVDLVQTFLDRADQAKMNVYRVADEQALVKQVCDIIKKVEAKTAIVPAEPFPGREQIVEQLKAENIRLQDPDEPDIAFNTDVGITGVQTAVAETGSIHLVSGGTRRRLASLAVPCHIAILQADQILPDLLDWTAQDQTDRAAGQVLVSGPSKTADIELQLVIGVHGPKEEHLIVVG